MILSNIAFDSKQLVARTMRVPPVGLFNFFFWKSALIVLSIAKTKDKFTYYKRLVLWMNNLSSVRLWVDVVKKYKGGGQGKFQFNRINFEKLI